MRRNKEERDFRFFVCACVFFSPAQHSPIHFPFHHSFSPPPPPPHFPHPFFLSLFFFFCPFTDAPAPRGASVRPPPERWPAGHVTIQTRSRREAANLGLAAPSHLTGHSDGASQHTHSTQHIVLSHKLFSSMHIFHAEATQGGENEGDPDDENGVLRDVLPLTSPGAREPGAPRAASSSAPLEPWRRRRRRL